MCMISTANCLICPLQEVHLGLLKLVSLFGSGKNTTNIYLSEIPCPCISNT